MTRLLAFVRRHAFTIASVIVISLALWLINITSERRSGGGLLTGLTLDASYLPLVLVETVIGSIEQTWNGYFYLVHVQEENEELRTEVARLEAEKKALAEVTFENQRLRYLLNFAERTNWPLMPVEVIGRVWSENSRMIIIDKGKSSGIRAGLPAVTADGVIGQVYLAGITSSKIMLITDPQSGLDVMVQNTRDKGIMVGLTVDYLPYTADVNVGDPIITSGMGRIYPKGLAVGSVDEVIKPPNDVFQQARIKPAVDFSKIEELFVILRPEFENESGLEEAQ